MEKAALKILKLLEQDHIGPKEAEKLLKALKADKPNKKTKKKKDKEIDTKNTVKDNKKEGQKSPSNSPKIKKKNTPIILDKSGNVMQRGEAPIVEEKGARPYQKDRDPGMGPY